MSIIAQEKKEDAGFLWESIHSSFACHIKISVRLIRVEDYIISTYAQGDVKPKQLAVGPLTQHVEYKTHMQLHLKETHGHNQNPRTNVYGNTYLLDAKGRVLIL